MEGYLCGGIMGFGAFIFFDAYRLVGRASFERIWVQIVIGAFAFAIGAGAGIYQILLAS